MKKPNAKYQAIIDSRARLAIQGFARYELVAVHPDDRTAIKKLADRLRNRRIKVKN